MVGRLLTRTARIGLGANHVNREGGSAWVELEGGGGPCRCPFQLRRARFGRRPMDVGWLCGER